MNKEQTQKVNMIDTTMAVLNMPVNKVLWNTNVAFSAAVSGVLTTMGSINSTDVTRMSGPQPFTETKGQAKTALIMATMLHAAAGRGYAASIGNTNMKTICTITETGLIRSPDTDLGNKCMLIYNAVQPNIGSMGAWAVTATTLGNLGGDITTFNSLIGTPQAQISTQHAAASTIDTQIETIMTALEDTMDTLMIQFKANHATFYEGYRSARKIHSTGVHHSTTFRGVITTTAGAALEHAEIVLTLGGNELRKHFTPADGHYRFTRLHLGDFTLTVSMAGYVTQTKTFSIADLQSVETDFVMVATGSGGGTTPTTGGTPASA